MVPVSRCLSFNSNSKEAKNGEQHKGLEHIERRHYGKYTLSDDHFLLPVYKKGIGVVRLQSSQTLLSTFGRRLHYESCYGNKVYSKVMDGNKVYSKVDLRQEDEIWLEFSNIQFWRKASRH